MKLAQNNFNGGVISDWINTRHDFQKYRSSMAYCRNFICSPYGALRRRMGFEYVDTSVSKSRLIAFQLSSTVGYVLEFGELYMRVYRDGARVGTVNVTMPYTAEEAYELQFIKLNTVLFLAHKNHPPREVRFISETNWTTAEMALTYPPFKDELLNGNKITVTASGTTPVVKTDPFNDSQVGATDKMIASLNGAGNYEFDVTTFVDNSGVGTGFVKLQNSTDGAVTWNDLHSLSGTGNHTGTASGLFRVILNDADAIGDIELTNNVADLSTGDAVNLSLGSSFFESGHIGTEFEISHVPEDREVRLEVSSTSGVSDPVTVQGSWNLFTNGRWARGDTSRGEFGQRGDLGVGDQTDWQLRQEFGR